MQSNKMKHLHTFESFLTEKIVYPEGGKSSGNKMLDKAAKLFNSSTNKVEITTNNLRIVNGKFAYSDVWTGFISKRPENAYYLFNTPKGFFRVEEADIKAPEDLYDEMEAIIQAGSPKRGKESDMFGKTK